MNTSTALIVIFALTAICFSVGLQVTERWYTLWSLVMLMPFGFLIAFFVVRGEEHKKPPPASSPSTPPSSAPATTSNRPASTTPPSTGASSSSSDLPKPSTSTTPASSSAVNKPTSGSSTSHPIQTTPKLLPAATDVTTPKEAFTKIAFALQNAFNKTKLPGTTGGRSYKPNFAMKGTPEYKLIQAFSGVKTDEEMTTLYKNGPPAYFADTLYNIYQRHNDHYMNNITYSSYSTPIEYFKALNSVQQPKWPPNVHVTNLYDENGEPRV